VELGIVSNSRVPLHPIGCTASSGLKGTTMKVWYARPVFFVNDAERAIEFYQQKLGFALDWNHQEQGRAFVCQVSRPGFELILAEEKSKSGHGRVFISLDKNQEDALRAQIQERQVEAKDSWWGMPIIQILDPDGNEMFFSPPSKK
jgi:catechol 2,3-dioxygenase-like lactoylglutathione lyase family enzyme